MVGLRKRRGAGLPGVGNGGDQGDQLALAVALASGTSYSITRTYRALSLSRHSPRRARGSGTAASTASSRPPSRPGTAQRSATRQWQGRSGMMAQREWPLSGDLAGIGTATITSRAVPAPTGLYRRVANYLDHRRPELADTLTANPLQAPLHSLHTSMGAIHHMRGQSGSHMIYSNSCRNQLLREEPHLLLGNKCPDGLTIVIISQDLSVIPRLTCASNTR